MRLVAAEVRCCTKMKCEISFHKDCSRKLLSAHVTERNMFTYKIFSRLLRRKGRKGTRSAVRRDLAIYRSMFPSLNLRDTREYLVFCL